MSVTVRRPEQRTAVTPRVVRRGLGFTGTGLAGAFFCLSLTPSLLPRSWVLQGAVGGITASMGYALGAPAGALARRLWVPSRRVTAAAWAALLSALPLAFAVFLVLGARWQRALRARLGVAPLDTYDSVLIVGVAAVTFAALLAVARGLRLATRGLVALLARVTPRPVASLAGVLVMALLAAALVDRVLLNAVLSAAARTAAVVDDGTGDDAAAPRTTLRSGGPFSLVGWESLGRQGRDFVGTGPGRERLSAFAGRPALEPVRVYAGLGSAGTTGERVRLILAELDRTGAFRRSVIAVLIPTGTGWVDSDVTDSLEYMYAGDTALVSMQYSYLPSWISFLAGREQAIEASRALIGAVRQRWAALPPGERPKLLIFGASLGTLGVEKAFGSAQAMTTGADGVLLEGPTFANPVRNSLVAGRVPGTPVWDPVPSRFPVEFADRAAELREPGLPRPRVVYLQNSSDPVVWWSPYLLVRKPPWLDSPRGPDVSPDMHWFPGVTFWQTTVDLALAKSTTAGHGHVYGSAAADGWAALAPPPNWQVTDTARLRDLLDAR
jgi:uncharacterized membrane protein